MMPEQIYKELVENKDFIDFNKLKLRLARKYHLKKIPKDAEILFGLNSEDYKSLKGKLIIKPTRTISGVAPIGLFAKPSRCPHGVCLFCCGGLNSYFGNVPQSYTGNEPGTRRAIRNLYDPYLQIMNRLEQYVVNNHDPDKTEIIIQGGTFLFFDKEYKEEFITYVYKALNDFSEIFYENGELDFIKFKEYFELPAKIDDDERVKRIHEKLFLLKGKSTLNYEQSRNEKSKIRCVSLLIETKPDYGKLSHGNEMLEYGTTKVELGVQTVYDDVLKFTHRGHNLQDSIESIQILKDLGFKLNFHMMPGLPNITKEQDINAFKEIFENPRYKPDMLKIYPCLVMPGTPLYRLWKLGKYNPINTEEAVEIICESKRFIPKFTRVDRINRDIPTKYTSSGVDRTNLRQYVEIKLKEKGITCNCIRCREIKNHKITGKVDFEIIEYEASNGKEFFISLIDQADHLIGFARLRFPGQFLRSEITENSALIRELHVYGRAIPIGAHLNRVQHKGYGKILMEKAEEISKNNQKNKILVISGVGVREYYRKLGYFLEGPYMVKLL